MNGSKYDDLAAILHELKSIASLIVSTELVSDRRGTRTWKVQTNIAEYVIKAASPTSDNIPPARDTLERESYVVTHVPELRTRFSPQAGTYRSSTGEKLPFLVMNWITGVSTLHTIRTVRDKDCLRDNHVVELLINILSALLPLHRRGWSHGDIQPDHLRQTQNGELVLLDFGCTHSLDMPLPGYRGGLVHFNAPEICATVLDGKDAVASPASDVFSAASVVYYAATGVLLGNYPPEASWEDKLKTLAQGHFTTKTARPEEALSKLAWQALNICLAIDPAKRPANADETLKMLSTH